MNRKEGLLIRSEILTCVAIPLLFIISSCAGSFHQPEYPSEPTGAKIDFGPQKTKKPRYPKPESASCAPLVKTDAFETQLARARDCLENKNYADIPSLVNPILEEVPDHPEARDLSNFAYYQLGKQLYNDNKYLASIDMFSHVSPDYKDTEQLLNSIRMKMEQQADVFYKQGVKYFINEKLQKAIAEWRRVLALAPDHPKARQDIENARRLLKKLKNID